MNKVGLFILAGSFGIAAIMLVIWLIGLLTGIAGNLIHLLLILALLVGGLGFVIGLVVLLVNRTK